MAMDFRDRLLTTDIKHLNETMRALSEEFLVIQDFVKYEFGVQLAKFLKIRGTFQPGSSKCSQPPPVLLSQAKRGNLITILPTSVVTRKHKSSKNTSSKKDLIRSREGSAYVDNAPSDDEEVGRSINVTKISEGEEDHSSSHLVQSGNSVVHKGTKENEEILENIDSQELQKAEQLSKQMQNNRNDNLHPTLKYDNTSGKIEQSQTEQTCSTNAPLVKVEIENSDFEEETTEETDFSNSGSLPSHFQLVGQGKEIEGQANPPRPKRPKRGGRTKDKLWSEFKKIGNKWACIHCDYTVKFPQLDRLKKHYDQCRKGIKKQRKQRSSNQDDRFGENPEPVPGPYRQQIENMRINQLSERNPIKSIETRDLSTGLCSKRQSSL